MATTKSTKYTKKKSKQRALPSGQAHHTLHAALPIYHQDQSGDRRADAACTWTWRLRQPTRRCDRASRASGTAKQLTDGLSVRGPPFVCLVCFVVRSSDGNHEIHEIHEKEIKAKSAALRSGAPHPTRRSSDLSSGSIRRPASRRCLHVDREITSTHEALRSCGPRKRDSEATDRRAFCPRPSFRVFSVFRGKTSVGNHEIQIGRASCRESK